MVTSWWWANYDSYYMFGKNQQLINCMFRLWSHDYATCNYVLLFPDLNDLGMRLRTIVNCSSQALQKTASNISSSGRQLNSLDEVIRMY